MELEQCRVVQEEFQKEKSYLQQCIKEKDQDSHNLKNRIRLIKELHKGALEKLEGDLTTTKQNLEVCDFDSDPYNTAP